MNKLISFILFISLLILSPVQASSICENIADDFVDEQNYKVAQWLGGGYDSDREHIKVVSCLNGERVDESGTAVGKLEMKLLTDISDVIQEINQHDSSKNSSQFDADISVGVPIVGGRIDFEYGKNREFIQNIAGVKSSYNYAQELTLAFNVVTGNRRFDIDGNNPFNKTGLDAADSGICDFKRICGNSFVHQTVEGVKLLVTIRIEFKSKADYDSYQRYHSEDVKTSLNASVSVVGFKAESNFRQSSQFTSSLSKIDESIRENGRFEVIAHQIGGDVASLGRIISGSSCKLSDYSSCLETLDNVVKYIGSDEFIDGAKENPGVLSYMKRDYREVSAKVVKSDEVIPEIVTARRSLADKFNERLYDITMIDNTLKSSSLPNVRRRELEVLRAELVSETEILRKTGISCFSDLANCEESAEKVLSDLKEYDREKIKVTMDDWLATEASDNINVGKLSGISTRCLVGTRAEDYMYAGFNISGGTKKVTLGTYSVTQIQGNNFLPRLEVKTFPDGESIYIDNNQYFTASIAKTLDLPEGWYTVTVSPIAQAGIGIVYVNEEDESSALLSSISTRCYVGTKAEDSMIAGVSVAGNNQCVEVLGLGITEIPGNSFLPMLNLQTFPDNKHFNVARSIYADINSEHQARVSKLQQLEVGPYTSMVTPVQAAGIGQVAISTGTTCTD
jgi:hypothetical protein